MTFNRLRFCPQIHKKLPNSHLNADQNERDDPIGYILILLISWYQGTGKYYNYTIIIIYRTVQPIAYSHSKFKPGIGIASSWSDSRFCSSVKRNTSSRSCLLRGLFFCLAAAIRLYVSIICTSEIESETSYFDSGHFRFQWNQLKYYLLVHGVQFAFNLQPIHLLPGHAVQLPQLVAVVLADGR